MTEVLLRRRGAALRVTLDRPRALNALTLAMVRAIDAALDEAEADAGIGVVVLDGNGERGFCAGGDIVALRDSALAGDSAALTFWREEYRLNARIASLETPVVVLMHGIVMGGGIGLGGHASHRVVAEDSVLAMPEVSIGFTPDVGSTWLLSRAPGEVGTHLAMTGARIGPKDALAVGLADVIVPKAQHSQLFDALSEGEGVAATLERFAVPVGSGLLAPAQAWISACYAGDDPAVTHERLRARSEPAAQAAAAMLAAASPTSVAVTLAALRRARDLPSLAACLEQELTVSRHFLTAPDFVEGIRAQVVDKDRSPRWRPARLGEVDPASVAAFFDPGV